MEKGSSAETVSQLQTGGWVDAKQVSDCHRVSRLARWSTILQVWEEGGGQCAFFYAAAYPCQSLYFFDALTENTNTDIAF